MRYPWAIIAAILFLLLPGYGQQDSLAAYRLLEQADYCLASEEYPAARAYLSGALPFFEAREKYREQAYIYLWLSDTDYYRGQVPLALEEAKFSCLVAESCLDPDTLPFYPTILQNIGLFYSHLGKFDTQMRYYQRSLAAALFYHGRYSERAADAFFSVGAAYGRRGHWGACIAYTDTSLYLSEAIGYTGGIASALLNLSHGFAEKEDFDKAIQYQKRALELATTQEEQARGLNNLGTQYIDIGAFSQALDALEKALAIRRKLYKPSDSNIFSTRLNIVRAYTEAGKLEPASRNLDDAIDGLLQSRESNIYMLQIAYNYKGKLELLLGEEETAEAMIRSALALEGSRQDINASSFMILGETLLAQQRFAEALAATQRGLMCQVAGFHPKGLLENPEWKAMEGVAQSRGLLQLKGDILRAIGLSENRHDRLLASLHTFLLGDSLVSSSRENYHSQESRDLLAANASDLYAGALRTLFNLYGQTQDTAYFSLAIQLIEKNKALSVLENLNELYARSFLDIPDEVVKAERELQGDIGFYSNLAKQARQYGGAPQLEEWELILFKKERSRDSLLEVIRRDYPRYYQMKHGFQLASVQPIEEKVLAEGECLLEYFIDGDSTFALLLARGQHLFFRLPTPELASQVLALRRAAISRDDDFYHLSHNLYRCLVEPLAPHIRGKKLAIIPDGVLAYLPFELLLAGPPASSGTRHAERPYLLKQYAIRYLFSANTALQSALAKAELTAPGKGILALAPSFSEGAVAERGEASFAGLPGAQAELDSLESRFQGLFLREEQATEANFKRHCRRSAVYHIATHTEINDRLPSASRLLLEAGEDDDGQLHVFELYNLRLPAALAVLSSCNTGIGKIKKGEGSASLAHAFAYAGCSNLVMSLWPVRDKTTPLLIKRYYDNMAAGMDKCEALRMAKIYCMEYDELFAHPYYWGGFIYAGDRSPLEIGLRRNPGDRWLLLVGGLLLLVIVLLRWNGIV